MTGRNFIQWYGSQAQLVVTEPELIKEILNDRDGVFPKAEVNAYYKKIFGDGIGTCKGEKWSKLRKLANYAFHGESLKVSSLCVTTSYINICILLVIR